jgi:hypothetical protein
VRKTGMTAFVITIISRDFFAKQYSIVRIAKNERFTLLFSVNARL